MIEVSFTFDRLTTNRIEIAFKIGRGEVGNKRQREVWHAEERGVATAALQAVAAIYVQHNMTMPTEVGTIVTTALDRINEDIPTE